jgi:hypothetical protein
MLTLIRGLTKGITQSPCRASQLRTWLDRCKLSGMWLSQLSLTQARMFRVSKNSPIQHAMGAQPPKIILKVKSRNSKKLRCKSRHKGLRRCHLTRLRPSKDSSIVILDPIPPMGIQELLVLLRTRAELFPEEIP